MDNRLPPPLRVPAWGLARLACGPGELPDMPAQGWNRPGGAEAEPAGFTPAWSTLRGGCAADNAGPGVGRRLRWNCGRGI